MVIQQSVTRSETVSQLRSGVLRRKNSRPVLTGAKLSRLGVIQKAKSLTQAPLYRQKVASNPSLMPSPSGGQDKKPGKRCKPRRVTSKGEQFEAILASVRPERRLRVKRIQACTVIKYAESADNFEQWCKHHRRSFKGDVRADRSMSVYFDALFEDGAEKTAASYTLFGFIALRMLPAVPEKQCLPLSRAALGAWRGSRAGSSRVGVVPQVIFHFADFCIKQKAVEACVAVLLQYDLYARPSEILKLKAGDLVRAVDAFGTPYGVLFGNSDFDEVTKAGAQDDVVLADSCHRPWCNDILKYLYKCLADADTQVFSLTLAQFEALFRDFSKVVGIKPGLFTPHVVRHSGPSYDIIHGHRTFEQIQSRGRWAAVQSVNRYRKPGRLLMEASKLPIQFRKYTEEPLHRALACVFRSKWAYASAL